MKDKFLNFSLQIIKKDNPNYDEVKLAEVKYGLEGMYLSITKLIIISIIAILLNIIKEMFILLFIFNVVRSTGFGLHATKSWICLLSSTMTFIILPFIAKVIVIPLFIKLILGLLAIFLAFKYSPADTKKRPLINKNKRKKYKIFTTLSTTILGVLCITIRNNVLSNLIIFGIYIEIILILPITYKLFNLSYNNYKNYQYSTD